ncbi:MAG: Lrp/AsnC family transcriptional regulator [Candidatus Aenigmarchaeota archaeon]|nr:Lrp/AsnC family transcriptional regulator [Candidatus Aenigmarchaeota archaeon]
MSTNNQDYDIPLNVLSIKDRKILKELFDDGRLPFSVIAKRVGLSKEVVNYRVKKLIEKRILIRFNTVIDVSKLGWQIYFINIRLRNIDDVVEEEIIKLMANHPNIAQVLKCIGTYDLVLKVFVKDYIEANNLMKSIEVKFKTHIAEYAIDFVEQEVTIPLPFLYEPFKIKEYQSIPKKDTNKVSVSSIDLQILKTVSHDARMPVADIAKKTGISRELARHHLKKLEKNNVIIKYRPSAWSGTKSIGYSWYLVMLKLNELNKTTEKKLQSYILNNLNMTYYYKCMGTHDIMFEIRPKTSDELNNVIMKMRSILKTGLKSHKLTIILKEYKYTYFPDCVMNTKA